MAIMEEQEELRQSFRNQGYSYVSRAQEILAVLLDLEHRQDLEVLAGITRTLKQQASLAGLFDISNMAYQLEGEILRLEETQAEMSMDVLETLGSYVDSIEQFLHFCYQQTDSNAPVEQLLKPEEGFLLTRQIQELYLVESREHIEGINTLLLQLESGKANQGDTLEEIYRNVHSIKGDSNALGMSEVAAKAHSLENVLSDLQQQKGKVDFEQMEVLFAEVAQLEQLVLIASGSFAQDQSEPAPEKQSETVQAAQAAVSVSESFSAAEPARPDSESESVKNAKGKKAKTIKAVKPAKKGSKAVEKTAETPDAPFETEANPAEDVSAFEAEADKTLSDSEPELTDPVLESSAGSESDAELEATFSEALADDESTWADLAESASESAATSDGAGQAPGDDHDLTDAETSAAGISAQVSDEDDDPDINEVDDLDFLIENQEILELYYQESQEILAEVSDGLVHLQEDGQDSALINDVYRAAHTLKGNSYALGIEFTGKAAQALEEALQPIRSAQACAPELLPHLSKLLKRVRNRLALIGSRLMIADPVVQEEVYPSYIPAPASKPVFELDLSEIDIPEEIRQIYLEESRELLEGVSHELLALELGQVPLGQALNEIFRLVHTLKGNSNALGITQLGDVLEHFESSVDEMRKHPEAYPGPEQLFAKIEPLQHLFARLSGDTEAAPPGLDVDLSEIPEEIRLIFLEEAFELLESISHHLLDLEEGEVTLEHVLDEVYRSVHTFKGNANALGLNFIGDSAHTMESLLSTLREDPSQYGPATTEALFRHLEGLRHQAEMLQSLNDADKEPVVAEPQRSTIDQKKTMITQERTVMQVVEAVRRDKSLFDEFEQRISSSKHKIDNRTTTEIKLDGPASTATAASAAQAQSAQPVVDETIRVSIGKVDKLINLADELLISRISFEQHLRTLRDMVGVFESAQTRLQGYLDKAGEAAQEALAPFQAALDKLELETNQLAKGIRKNNAAFGLLVDEIQYNSRSTRMLPAAYLINPVRLVVRNTSAKLGKKVQLQIIGEDIEMDRLLIERLKDPLGHLLRNAIDHGVEMPDERSKNGKTADARITIAISVAGNMIRFQIHDDGRGINYDRVRQKAVNVGMLSSEMAAQLSEYDLNGLLFAAGFSTTDKVTDVSGRGVGLDVVKATIDALNGSIEVTSSAGRGTIFTLMVPVTLTTFDAFLVQLAGHTFALPRSAVVATLSVKHEDVTDNGISKSIFFADHPVRLVSLQQLLQLPASEHDSGGEFAVLVVESGQQRLALMVDTVVESQQMVMKTLGSQLKKVPYVSGATLLGNGEPVVVLNLTEIVAQLTNVGTERMSVMIPSHVSESSVVKRSKGKTRVLVVDDSVTTRTLEKNILEAAGFEVVIAKHGREGQEAVIREMPNLDLVITDVEMPHMTGYEFASWLKLESEYRATPCIMVTSLASPEFKAKGFASGIDAYIVKGEFNQQTLLDTISQLLISA